MLVRPEYRSKLDSKYKRKIEQIVRRPEKDERDEDFKTQCPFCSTLVPDNVLDCLECKNHIPYCIASGKHMILQDWSYCPRCEFPALHSRMKSVLESTGQCPMCSQNVDASSLTLVDDPTELLKGRKESEKDDDGGGDADEQKQIIVSDAAAANADSPATAQQLEGKVRSVPVPSSMGF